ncbi:ComEA family DNA-binding protein [Streptomyces beigongshangae]|uniref:ComEA family DNA-binding protein n=1 Tax=Streptomyces beigongshangae TaxID=2841597 RepID=UPI0027DFE0DF|nr:ComEA family DNA-binding protein [Streptomyces sp. REN17]
MQTQAQALRLRAETLFGGAGDERAGPRPEPANPDTGLAAEAEDAAAKGKAGGAEAAWRERAGLAVRERMPLWLQTRCGLERRSVTALAVVLAVAVVLAAQHFWSGRIQPVRAPETVQAASPYGEGDGEKGYKGYGEKPGGGQGPASGGSAAAQVPVGAVGTAIVVDVSGKVHEPGVHRLPAGSRVADALKAAGGVRPGADTGGLNRARFLVDGEQVVVGAPPAVAGPGATGTSGGAGPGGTAPAVTAPVALSTATLEQLDTLPGVGPVLAQHIMDYRAQHGGFRSVDELREVNGIGDRRFADLQKLVRP